MIKNERQYRITKAQAERFARALAKAASHQGDDPLLDELETAALRSQMDELQQQLEEYEVLRSGKCGVISVDSFDELPQALVRARIALGLSQKELGQRLGMKEQQIQRYEATDYRSASLARLNDVVDALGVKLRKEFFLPQQPLNAPAFFDRLKSAGLERDFVLKRILPPAIAERVMCKAPTPTDSERQQAATTIGRVFRWETDELLGTQPLRLQTEPAGIARFKVPSGVNERKVSAYTVYAHYLALLVLQGTPDLEPKQVPTDAEKCRDDILSHVGAVTLESVLDYAWRLGIPVLPLSDPGAFHGAFWRIDGRNVVVLKQLTNSRARWTNDCLHEIYHAGQEPDKQWAFGERAKSRSGGLAG